MPELPEVRTVVKALNSVLENKIIADVTVIKEKMIKDISANDFITKLKNKKILKVSNFGKFIVFFLEDDLVMLSHLRMEGKYHMTEWDNPKHDHVVFTFKDNTKLYYNDTRQFGTFHLKNLSNYLITKPLSEMGPIPSEADYLKIYDQVKNKKAPIKSTLLDQSILSGLGNIYVDEVLWDVKIHPETPSNKITKEQIKQIIISSSVILEKATLAGGSTIRSYASFDNTEGDYQNQLKVHMQVNKECFRCKEKIIKIRVGGRGTYLCPKEQKL